MKRPNGFSSGVMVVSLGLIAMPSSNAKGADKHTYTIDPVHSTAIFGVHHLGAGRFYGRFNNLSGTIIHAEGSKSEFAFDVTIAVESVDTGIDKLNGHLKSPDFFNAKEFPHITFKSKSARKVDDKIYEVEGDLTIHGVTQPMTARVEWLGTADGRLGTRCGFETSLTLKRSEFGMQYGLKGNMLGDEVKVIVAMEAALAGEAPGGRGRRGAK